MRYRLDSADRVSEVDEEWLPFAIENEAPSLTPDAVLGRPLYSFISDPTTTHLWQELLARVRSGGLLDLNVRCDSPSWIRLIRICASAESGGSVAFSTGILHVAHRAPVPVPPARPSGGTLTLCSWCQRLRMPSSEWAELQEGIIRLELFGRISPGLISHGICPDCYTRALAEFPMQGPASA
jgi:hypothetical protein